MKLIVGLGNPGKNYEGTRHNIGFHFVDERNKNNTDEKRKFVAKFQGEIIQTQRNDQKVLLCKPQTYMNCSGSVIAPLARFYQISPQDILVVHDEIDFETGRIALKFGGSAAGHNGLKSIIEKLGTKDFWRLRIGVDRPREQSQVTNRVLGKFRTEEKKLLDGKKQDIFDAIEEFLILE